MPTITQLPAHVVSLIAAGEIAERPSTIIKELIENSLDAGATQIEVVLEQAGLEKILVADNGKGMRSDDLHLSVLNHATSKISEAKDLDAIRSFGFRGEALASIAKVSNLSIVSRHIDHDTPYRYIHATKETLPSKQGMAIGTVVEIKELFSRLPARRKFLNKPQSELRHTLDVIAKIALANHTVGITVHHNNKQLQHFPLHQSLSDRFLQVTDWELEHKLIPVEFSNELISVSGLITHPTYTKSHTQHQWLFINNRPVHHPGLSRTIKLSYKASIPPEKHPLFVLNVSLEPNLFDINCHPKKETVRFMDEQLVQSMVSKAIEETLQQTLDPESGDSLPASASIQGLTLKEPAMSSPTTDEQSQEPNTQPLDPTAFINKNADTNPEKHRGHFPAEKFISSTLKNLIAPWKANDGKTLETKPILQIANTFLVTEHDNQVLMIDQHAAHERILYESLRSIYNNEQNKEPQKLQPPLACSLTAQQVLLIEEHLPTLEKIGFAGHFLGKDTFALTTIPPLLPIEQTKRILLDVLEDLAHGYPVSLVDSVAHRTIAYVACRSAIMAGDPLDENERYELVEKLFKTKNYQTCPHGRPTILLYDTAKLEKLFGRR